MVNAPSLRRGAGVLVTGCGAPIYLFKLTLLLRTQGRANGVVALQGAICKSREAVILALKATALTLLSLFSFIEFAVQAP